MMLRKIALLLAFTAGLLLSFTFKGYSQNQEAYRYLSDFSYLTKDRRSLDEKREDFIKALKRGDRHAFQVTNYDVILAVSVRLKKDADDVLKTKGPLEVGFLKALMMQMGGDEERARATLVQATLPGIFNLDPRVRLVATSWLRNLRPDVSMMRAVKLAVGVDVNVIRYDQNQDDFVFTAPRILETVAGWHEYYREKDLDFPGVFSPGAVATIDPLDNKVKNIGGGGVNDNNRVTNEMNRDDGNIVTGLDARRWGSPKGWDQTRKWEKQLPSLGQNATGAGNDAGLPVASLADYYERLNAALKIALSGLEESKKMPDGRQFSRGLYETSSKHCTLRMDAANNPIPGSCLEMENDRDESVRRSIDGQFPGHTLVVKPIAGTDLGSSITDETGLEAHPDNRDAYRYYPDMTPNGRSLANVDQKQRDKMQLLLHQNWQQGTRVPIGQGRMYVYVNAKGQIVIGNPWAELTKLDMFITRHVWYNKIKSGYLKTLAVMNKDTFATLYNSIDGESPDVIPMLSAAGPTPMFDYKDVDVLLYGMRHTHVTSNEYVLTRVLKDIYEQKPPRAALCPPEIQRKININLWEERRSENRHDIEVGKLFYNELLTVGKAPARPEINAPLAKAGGVGGGTTTAGGSLLDPYGPVGAAQVDARARIVDLGFAQPNDEILANSHRVIVSEVDLSPADPTKKLDSKVAYSLDKLFKQRFYYLVGTDNQRRDYYMHRVEYTRLWRDNSMPLVASDAPAQKPADGTWGLGATDQKMLAVNADANPMPRAAEPNDTTVPRATLPDAFGKTMPGTAAKMVTDKTSFWEASRYTDSLVVYNIERMQRVQQLINDLLNGRRQAFMEATWADVESAVILTLKRLETIHRYKTGLVNSKCEDPSNVSAADGATAPGCFVKPELSFFDAFLNLDVIKTYSADSPDIKASIMDQATGKARDIQVRRTQEFVPIIDQVKDISRNTYSEDKRNNLIQAALGGIFNKDPRVRLTAIHFLRTLGPDETMMADIEKARNINATATTGVNENSETDDYRSAFIDTHVYRRVGGDTDQLTTIADYYVEDQHKYEGAVDKDVEARARSNDDGDQYIAYLKSLPSTVRFRESMPHPAYDPSKNEFSRVVMLPTEGSQAGNAPRAARFYGFYQLKAPAEELEKLYKMIRRKQLVKAIRNGDVNAVKKMTRSEFTILSEAVDNEWRGYIPFQSFHATAENQQTFGKAIPSNLAIFNGKDIRVIKAGIDNSNFLVQKGTAEFLIRFYNFYDRCTDFRTRTTKTGCTDGGGYEPNGTYKKEIRDAMYYYIQDDIVVQEFELAFNGENPDGRAVIHAGTNLSMHLNPGGERVYLSLPERIRKDIRDAVWGDYERLPEELKNILGIISARAPRPNVLTYYNVMLGLEPRVPWGDAGDQLRDDLVTK